MGVGVGEGGHSFLLCRNCRNLPVCNILMATASGHFFNTNTQSGSTPTVESSRLVWPPTQESHCRAIPLSSLYPACQFSGV